MTLLLALGCVHPQPSACCDPATDSGDTGPADSDSARDTDTSDSGDTPDTDTADTDTSDTSIEANLVGSFSLSGTVNGVSVSLNCDAATDPELFAGYWGSSLGNLSGSVACADAAGQRVTVSYINPSAGEWTDTSDGKSWIFEDGSGGVLAWGVPDTTAWDLAFTTYTFVDATTVELDGTLAGTWSADGAVYADLAGTFGVQLPCNSGC